MSDYTPSIKDFREDFVTATVQSAWMSGPAARDYFDRMITEVRREAKADALRETADHIAATDHFMIDGDKYTPCSSCKSIHYQYLDYRADRLEGDDE